MMMNKALPYDAEVEYLESTGTQYVNLISGINSENDEIVITFIATSRGSNTPGIFGARVSASNKNASVIATQSMIVDVNSSNYSSYRLVYNSTYIGLVTECKLSLSERYIKINGEEVSSSATTDRFTTSSAYLFGVNGLVDRVPIRFVSLDWKRKRQPYMQLIPVRKGTRGYVYDKVSGQLFGNVGTEQFILGLDKMGGVIKWLIINTLHGLSNPSLEERRAA